MLRLREEVEFDAFVELGLTELAAIEERFAPLVERTVQQGEEDRGIFAQDFASLVIQCTVDCDVFEDLFRVDRFGQSTDDWTRDGRHIAAAFWF
jgi:hypothetical protein